MKTPQPPALPKCTIYTVKLKILTVAGVRLRLHHRRDVLPDRALQENVVSHDVLDLDGVGPRVVQDRVEGGRVLEEVVAERRRRRVRLPEASVPGRN